MRPIQLAVGLWTAGPANRPPGQLKPRVSLLATSLAALLILTAATTAAGQTIEAPPSAELGEVVALKATLPEGAASAWAIVATLDGYTLILAYGSADCVEIVSQAIAVKRPPPGDDPEDPDSPVNEKVIRAWLDAVPADAREVAVTNPITKASATRQQNVGRTFSGIGQVARSLGSIRACNVMLATGLAASYGDGAAEWEPFDAAARKALGVMAAEGANATEYGEALGLIGEVLR